VPYLALKPVWVKTRTGLDFIIERGVFACKKKPPATVAHRMSAITQENSIKCSLTWVEFIKVYTKFTKAWEELGLNASMDGVVTTLVRSRLDLTVGTTKGYHLSDLPPSALTLARDKYLEILPTTCSC
jgi:hypothetical protein